MANNTQFKHTSNQQQVKKQKNKQAGKTYSNRNDKPYVRTSPKPKEKAKETEEHRLKRVEVTSKGNTGLKKRADKKSDPSEIRQDNSSKPKSQDGSMTKVQDSRKTKNQGSSNDQLQVQKNQENQTSKGKKKSNQNNNQEPSKSHQSKNGSGKKVSNEQPPNDNKNSDLDSKSSEKTDVKHKEQSGKFETAFNRIHKELKEMVKGTDSDAFVELLYSGYKNHSLIRKYKNELHQFAKLRNAIVHERVNADFYIAEPHIEVVERIEEIAKEFEKPQTALSIATSPVFYYYEDAYLQDVLKVIKKFDFTRFPVYDKDDKYIALLTSTEIIQWMAKHFSDSVVHFEDVRVKELLTKGKNYFVLFVDEDASLYHIEELFERYHTKGKKLQAVIITETGDRHGKPIGVITPWDLLESDQED